MMSDLNYQRFGVDDVIADAYAESLREHIACVRETGRKIGVRPSQLAVHDQSRWSQLEFPGCAKHFKGGGDPDGFAAAWVHHIHHNPHHWQHWIFSSVYTPKKSQVEYGIVEMPPHYALEMIADWMGASFADTHSWDMSACLLDNIPKIKVHSLTAQYLKEILCELEYEAIINTVNFGNNK